jgi:hypothetical protein
MYPRLASCFFILTSLSINAQTINLHGVVFNKAGKPIPRAIVILVRQGLKDTTGTDGAYLITTRTSSAAPATAPDAGKISIDEGILEFPLNNPSALKVEIFDTKGDRLKGLSRSAAAGR